MQAQVVGAFRVFAEQYTGHREPGPGTLLTSAMGLCNYVYK